MRVEIFLHLRRTWPTYHEQQSRITFSWQPEVKKPCQCLQKGTYGSFASAQGRFVTQENAGRQMGTTLFPSQAHKWERVQINASNRELSPGALACPPAAPPVLCWPVLLHSRALSWQRQFQVFFRLAPAPNCPMWGLCQTSSALPWQHSDLWLNPSSSCW